ncbi:hypothetical protein [Sulfitobacter sp. 15WGC]|jgi:putative transcriptional regulator|uniref:helix-turn-helix domain-containing protein n=1 Tax=Sulfitobacter sp. 15WGC TaxID=2575437 RepID=UPI0010ACEEBE|nr:hypothetical protein [Sulfitobacter sp. 15WGC]TKA84379.1 hypothetical protein FCK22_16190 [Sulfitobacter sp. 15WGC]
MTKTRDETRQHQREIHRRAVAGEMALPESVRFIREGLGWSQSYFAEKFHVTVEQLEAIESGEMGEAFAALERIGKLWGFEITYVRHMPQD